MEKHEFCSLLQIEISKGKALLDRFERLQEYNEGLGDGMALFGSRLMHKYNPDEKNRLANDFTLWERRVFEILKCYLGGDSSIVEAEFSTSDVRYWMNFKSSGITCLNSNLTTLRSCLERIDYLEPKSVEHNDSNQLTMTSKDKPFKVFISHSGEDIAFVNELVVLLEFLGVDTPEKLLCTSIKGYQIPASEDFAEYIFKQFHNYNLFVIIVHSHNYYSSPYSLNEMGAAWVLKTDFYSFLVKGFDYTDMEGVINQRTISVKVDADDADARLNELKNKLVPLFKPQGVNGCRWETLRDDFLKKVNALSLSFSDDVASCDLFLSCYIPIFDKILSLVDMPNYPYWTYNWALAGTSKITVTRYRNLEELNSFLQRICYHKGYERYDNLLKNLGTLVSDYIYLCDEHLENFGHDAYTIERFYKKIPNNPNYNRLLNEFYEYCWLMCDLTLELTRLLNLLLERIRERVSDYHIDKGVFVIDLIAREKTEYRDNEKSDSPYPGLKQFVLTRSTRNHCYSKTSTLNFI